MMNQRPVNSKIAERLKILHTRTKRVLIQIHYLKRTLLNENGFFTKFCENSAFDPAIKLLNKKFPNIEIKANKTVLDPLISQHVNILRELQFHYNTLVDVIEVKDNLIDLLGQISAFQFNLDINMNTDMTRLYLNLVTDYTCIMLLLSSIPQIQLILSLYSLAFMVKFDQDERSYPRLCERLVEKHKDGCILELYNELNPYSRMLLNALSSVSLLLSGKLSSSSEWEGSQLFHISPSNLPDSTKLPSFTTLIPFTRIHRWLLFGYLVVYPEITRSQTVMKTFRTVLDTATSVVIFRDELLPVHHFIGKFFGSQKGMSKLQSIVKESHREFSGGATVALHRSRRNYLRLVMRRQLQLLADQPGIMGPNAVTLCRTVGCAADEVLWLIAHADQPPSKKATAKQAHGEEWSDALLPEFLWEMEELRHLLTEFDVVPTYFRRVLSEVDLPSLPLDCDGGDSGVSSGLCDDDSAILASFTEKLSSLNDPAVVTDGTQLKSLRLDWLRLQTFLSCQDSLFPWMERAALVRQLNAVALHSHLVDHADRLLDRCTGLEQLCHHQATLRQWFDDSLKMAAQHRYVVVFPRLCGHFLRSTATDCPEDFNQVLRTSTEMAHSFLTAICLELCKMTASVLKTQFDLGQKCQPLVAVDLYHLHFFRRQKDQQQQQDPSTATTGSTKCPVKVDLSQLPGSESRRTNVEATTPFDRELAILSQLATGLNSRPIIVNNRTLSPSLYLKKELVKLLNEKLVSLTNVRFKRDKHEGILGVRRATDMKLIILECMCAVSRISEYANINVSLIFMEVFLCQSLITDPMGRTTLTDMYSNWYVDFILNQPHILHSPLLKCFVTINPSNAKDASNIVIDVEEFTDINELRTLVEVIGPFGMRNLNEKIIQMIIKNISALRRFVQRNRTTLLELNVINLDYAKIKKLLHDIEDIDDFCQNWKQMGILFAFRDLCREAIRDIATKSMPFLKSTVIDLQQDLDTDQIDHLSSVSENESPSDNGFKNQLILNELCQGFGLKTKVDSTLFNALEAIRCQQQQIQSGQLENMAQSEDLQNTLLMVATSYLLPRLVGSNFYHIEYEALDDNAHCAAYAIKELMYAFFSRYGDERMLLEIRKFIGLTSSNLLRLGIIESTSHSQSNKEEAILIKNRDSIYIFFDFVIQTLENVSEDFYEECFPYALVRQAYHNVVKQSRQVIIQAAHPTDASSKAAIEASKFDAK